MPVCGSASSLAMLRSPSAANSCAASASTDAADAIASPTRDFNATTFGHGASRPAFERPYKPGPRRRGWPSTFDAQKHSPRLKSAAIRLKPLWPESAVRVQKSAVDSRAASHSETIRPRDGASASCARPSRTFVSNAMRPCAVRPSQVPPDFRSRPLSTAGAPSEGVHQPRRSVGRSKNSSRFDAITSGKHGCWSIASATRHMR